MANFVPWPATEEVLHIEDVNAKHGTFRAWLAGIITDPNGVPADAIALGVDNLTDGAIVAIELTNRAARTDAGTPSSWAATPYSSALDKAKFRLKANDGTIATMNLGTPLASILDSTDKTLVNMAQADVAALIAYWKANFVTAEGTVLTDSVVEQGYRTRPSRRKNPLGRG